MEINLTKMTMSKVQNNMAVEKYNEKNVTHSCENSENLEWFT